MIDHSKDSLSEALGISNDKVAEFLAESFPETKGKPSKLIEHLMNSDLSEPEKLFGAFLLGQSLAHSMMEREESSRNS